ncbi:MAG: TRAP transporter small permease [Deltaproteobacteria bacterium]|nr:TRAP transporter small permease [Deltaproteobacteria bacterium]
MRKAFYYLDKVLSFFEEWTLFLMVFAALVGLFITVVTRYTITYTMTWPEEFVRQVIMYTTFIGCSVAIRNRAMIRIDAIPNLIKSLAKPLDFVNHVAVLVFAGFATYYGIKLVQLQMMTGQVTTVMKIPQRYLYCVLPLMGILMVLRQLQVLYEDLTGKPISAK